MDFTLLYHLWHPKAKYVESSSRYIQNGHDIGSMRDKAIRSIEEIASQDNAKILRLGIFEAKGILEITDFPSKHDAYSWKKTWADAQAEIQATIHLKQYGVQTSLGYNLSCPDFRCALPLIKNPLHMPHAYMGCPGQHPASDPYFPENGINITKKDRIAMYQNMTGSSSLEIPLLEENTFDKEILIPQLAKWLHEKRGTKAQTLARFECWKADTEHRLQYWNPFERKA